jgi:hypothetical protein
MSWDPTMPSNFTDGSLVDEGDLDPIVNNLEYVHYATVFQGGVRRITAIGAITTTTIAVMQTPSVAFEAGTLYEIKGFVKWFSTVAADSIIINVREGAGLAGASIQSFESPAAKQSLNGNMTPFNVYVKVTGAVTRPYTVGVVRGAGSGTITVDTTSQMVILRSGDSTLMTDV